MRSAPHHRRTSAVGGGSSSTTTTPSPHLDVCRELRRSNAEIQDKLDMLYRSSQFAVVGGDYGGGGGGDNSEAGARYAEEEEDSPANRRSSSPQQKQQQQVSSAVDRHVLRLYRRIAAPFRKANRRLREMEEVKAEFDAVARGVGASVDGALEDIDRRYRGVKSKSIQHTVAKGRKENEVQLQLQQQ